MNFMKLDVATVMRLLIEELMIELLSFALKIYQLLILLRVVFSWIMNDPYNQFYQLLIKATEPVLKPIRQMLPRTGTFDLSPIVALFLISIIQRLLFRQLYF